MTADSGGPCLNTDEDHLRWKADNDHAWDGMADQREFLRAALRLLDDARAEARCETCQGRNRETTDMVCMTCGRDYMPDDGSDETGPGLGWKRLMLAWRKLYKDAEKETDKAGAAADRPEADAATARVPVVEARKAALHEAADELEALVQSTVAAHLKWPEVEPIPLPVSNWLRARADVQGSTPPLAQAPEACRVGHSLYGVCELDWGHVGPHSRVPGGATGPVTWEQGDCPCEPCVTYRAGGKVPGTEVGTFIGLDLNAVRDGHVPWPGDADDGTCSCCGMPQPCVTRRLADEVERLARSYRMRCSHLEDAEQRAEEAEGYREEAANQWAIWQARAETAERQVAAVRERCAAWAASSGVAGELQAKSMLAALDDAVHQTPAAGVNAAVPPAMAGHDDPESAAATAPGGLHSGVLDLLRAHGPACGGCVCGAPFTVEHLADVLLPPIGIARAEADRG